MVRHDPEGQVLDELREIYRAVHDSYFHKNFPEFAIAKKVKTAMEGMHSYLKQAVSTEAGSSELPEEVKAAMNGMGKEIQNIGGNIALPKRVLETAVEDLTILKTRAKDCGEYIHTAIDLYSKFLESFVKIEDQVIRNNIDEFISLYKLFNTCIIESPSYMRVPAPNRCRGGVYDATNAITKLEELAGLADAVGSNHKVGIDEAKKAVEAHLTMCKVCPFMGYGRKQQEQ